MELELESIGQHGLKHLPELFLRGAGNIFGFGLDAESLDHTGYPNTLSPLRTA